MKLGQVAVNIENVERAVAFYKDVVKLSLWKIGMMKPCFPKLSHQDSCIRHD